MLLSQWLISALLILVCCADPQSSSHKRYALKHNNDGGCSYTGSWLAHINLYRRIAYFVDICRAEAASYEIQKTARFQYVFDEADKHAFFVHHLSNYEHVNHAEYGFAQAQNKTATLSSAAFLGECSALTSAATSRYGPQSVDPSSPAASAVHPAPSLSKRAKRQPLSDARVDRSPTGNRGEFLALVPFYGGLPPNTSAGAFLTDSLGQGNSRVSLEVKAHQAMATVCSCLRYFGHVVVGVARSEDRQQMKKLIHASFNSHQLRHRISIVQFQLVKPVHLIFHLLVWGQHYVKIHNCLRFARPHQSPSNSTSQRSHPQYNVRGLQEKKGWWKGKLKKLHFEEHSLPPLEVDLSGGDGAFDICRSGSIQSSYYALTALNVSYSSLSNPIPRRNQRRDDDSQLPSIGGAVVHPVHSTPIKYVYFTEGDQLVRFRDERIKDDIPMTSSSSSSSLIGISSVLNETLYIIGRRREKARDSSAVEYMGGLDDGRSCGLGSYYYSYDYSRTINTTISSVSYSNYVFATN